MIDFRSMLGLQMMQQCLIETGNAGNRSKLALCRYKSMRVMQQAVRKMVKTAQRFAKRTAAAIKMQVCPGHVSTCELPHSVCHARWI